jgi:hypothetical protein
MRRPAPEGRPPSVRELIGELSPERLAAVLRAFGALVGSDRSSARLRQVTGGELDLGIDAHRAALLVWLRSWGCRHLRVIDTRRSSLALARWWERNAASLPEPGRSLVEMSGRDLDAAASAFGALASSPAAWRSLSEGRASVSFGQTAAAKAFFAIRPLAFPPWDEPIRAALGLRGEGGSGYRSYLEQVALVLEDLVDRLRVPVSGVPAALGRPRSTPPKLVDEVLWMRVNRPGR